MKFEIIKDTITNTTSDDAFEIISIKRDGAIVATITESDDAATFNFIHELAAADGVEFKGFQADKRDPRSKMSFYRDQKCLTLEQLADIVGCTRQTLSKVELRQSIPRLDLAVKIADVLKMDIRDIL